MTEPLPLGIDVTRTFSSGIELSNRLGGSYDIRTGILNQNVPPNLQFIPGVRHEGNNELLSGEAFTLPRDEPISIVLGRNSKVCDVKIDADFIDSNALTGKLLASKENDLLKSLSSLDAALQENGHEELKTLVDVGDLGISRVAIQISRHPNGVTTVTHLLLSEKALYDNPLVIRDNRGELAQEKFRGGSSTLKNGDTILVEGQQRIVALRYFDQKPGENQVFDKPTFVKQSFPAYTPTEEIFKWIYGKEEIPSTQ